MVNWSDIMSVYSEETNWVEERSVVLAFLAKLKFMLESPRTRIHLDIKKSDQYKPYEFTNRFTFADLFPNENPVDVLRRELSLLTISDYMHTAIDVINQKSPNYYVFAKKFGKYVYIKVKIVVFNGSIPGQQDTMLVMSFHYAEFYIDDNSFQYLKR